MKRPRVLVIDDDAELRHTVALVLGDAYEIVEAANGLDGLEAAKSKPDLVILDVAMPVLGGLETLNALRAAHPSLPVVMLTSADDIERAQAALRAGALEYITKPFDVADLRSEVERLTSVGVEAEKGEAK